jgi:hypothetical protein
LPLLPLGGGFVTDCQQELCPNWSGDGNVCPCAIFDIDPPKRCCNLDCDREGTVFVGDLTTLGDYACSLCEVYIVGDGNDD